jgi:hypothetical protein
LPKCITDQIIVRSLKNLRRMSEHEESGGLRRPARQSATSKPKGGN